MNNISQCEWCGNPSNKGKWDDIVTVLLNAICLLRKASQQIVCPQDVCSQNTNNFKMNVVRFTTIFKTQQNAQTLCKAMRTSFCLCPLTRLKTKIWMTSWMFFVSSSVLWITVDPECGSQPKNNNQSSWSWTTLAKISRWFPSGRHVDPQFHGCRCVRFSFCAAGVEQNFKMLTNCIYVGMFKSKFQLHLQLSCLCFAFNKEDVLIISVFEPLTKSKWCHMQTELLSLICLWINCLSHRSRREDGFDFKQMERCRCHLEEALWAHNNDRWPLRVQSNQSECPLPRFRGDMSHWSFQGRMGGQGTDLGSHQQWSGKQHQQDARSMTTLSALAWTPSVGFMAAREWKCAQKLRHGHVTNGCKWPTWVPQGRNGRVDREHQAQQMKSSFWWQQLGSRLMDMHAEQHGGVVGLSSQSFTFTNPRPRRHDSCTFKWSAGCFGIFLSGATNDNEGSVMVQTASSSPPGLSAKRVKDHPLQDPATRPIKAPGQGNELCPKSSTWRSHNTQMRCTWSSTWQTSNKLLMHARSFISVEQDTFSSGHCICQSVKEILIEQSNCAALLKTTNNSQKFTPGDWNQICMPLSTTPTSLHPRCSVHLHTMSIDGWEIHGCEVITFETSSQTAFVIHLPGAAGCGIPLQEFGWISANRLTCWSGIDILIVLLFMACVLGWAHREHRGWWISGVGLSMRTVWQCCLFVCVSCFFFFVCLHWPHLFWPMVASCQASLVWLVAADEILTAECCWARGGCGECMVGHIVKAPFFSFCLLLLPFPCRCVDCVPLFPASPPCGVCGMHFCHFLSEMLLGCLSVWSHMWRVFFFSFLFASCVVLDLPGGQFSWIIGSAGGGLHILWLFVCGDGLLCVVLDSWLHLGCVKKNKRLLAAKIKHPTKEHWLQDWSHLGFVRDNERHQDQKIESGNQCSLPVDLVGTQLS